MQKLTTDNRQLTTAKTTNHGEHGRSRAARKPRPWLADRVRRRLWRMRIEPWCVHVVGLLMLVAELETKCFSLLKDLVWQLLGMS
jgi:hypothetical protein